MAMESAKTFPPQMQDLQVFYMVNDFIGNTEAMMVLVKFRKKQRNRIVYPKSLLFFEFVKIEKQKNKKIWMIFLLF